MSEQHEPSRLHNEELTWMRERVRWVQEHPWRFCLAIMASLIAAAIWQHWGFQQPSAEVPVSHQVTDLRQELDELRQRFDRFEGTDAVKLSEIDQVNRSQDQRISQTEGFAHEIRRIEQRLDIELPGLKQLASKVTVLETGAEAASNRISRLENGTSRDAADGRHQDGRIETTLERLNAVDGRTRRLEGSVEQLLLVHSNGNSNQTTGVEDEINVLQQEIRALEAKVGVLEARLETSEVQEPPIAQTSDSEMTSVPHPQGTSIASTIATCRGPVDPKVPFGEVVRPRLVEEETPKKRRQHPQLLRNLELDLCLTIGADGNVQDAQILDGQEAHRPFHREAKRACRRWRFTPASWRGESIAWRKRVAVVFEP